MPVLGEWSTIRKLFCPEMGFGEILDDVLEADFWELGLIF